MDSLAAAFDAVAAKRKTLVVYSADESVASELEGQFSTRNVEVHCRPLPAGVAQGFVVVRDPAGAFRGALGTDDLDALLSPATHPPWLLDRSGVETGNMFDFLENTLFSSFDRRRMLVTSREFEERAVRTGNGRLYVGFQRAGAFAAQRGLYERLVRESSLHLLVCIEDEWRPAETPIQTVVDEAGTEIGEYWFVLFDGGDRRENACGLLAEEREPGAYYGFWTYDESLVESITSYLRSRYDLA